MESTTIFEISDEQVFIFGTTILLIMLLYGWFRKKPFMLALAILYLIRFYGDGWIDLIPNRIIEIVLGILFDVFNFLLFIKIYNFYSEKFSSDN